MVVGKCYVSVRSAWISRIAETKLMGINALSGSEKSWSGKVALSLVRRGWIRGIPIKIKVKVLVATWNTIRTTWLESITRRRCWRCCLLRAHTTLAAYLPNQKRSKLLTFLDIQRDFRLAFPSSILRRRTAIRIISTDICIEISRHPTRVIIIIIRTLAAITSK